MLFKALHGLAPGYISDYCVGLDKPVAIESTICKLQLLRADKRHIKFGWLLGNSAVYRSLVYFYYIYLVVDSLVI